MRITPLTTETARCSDIDLKLFGDRRQAYFVEVLGSPQGRRNAVSLVLPVNVESRVRNLRNRQTDRTEASRLGIALFEALFPTAIRQIWDGITKSQINRLRLDIRAHELMNLPWELINDGREYLALSERTPIVRFLAENPSADHFEVNGPLEFLLVTATPRDLPPLPGVMTELNTVRQQLATPTPKLSLGGAEIIEHVSLSALQAKLDRAHIVHYMGHGDFSDDRGYLLLENKDGTSERQEAEIVGNHMRDGAVRVLVLNACDTAISSSDKSLIGVAHAAHKAGIPVVIAMQQTILDRAAPEFAGGFYQALIAGKPLESCMVAGRLAIQRQVGLDSGEWAIPVMFSNAPAGKLCLLQTSNEQKEQPIENSLNAGRDAYGSAKNVFSGQFQAGRDNNFYVGSDPRQAPRPGQETDE